MSEFDGPWKEALEKFFPPFLELFFRDVHAAIDWSRAHEPLDKELQQVVREAAVGRQFVDKLFKVFLRDGTEQWVMIHVEVQSQRDDEFAERMYLYNSRLYERYRRPVVSLAALGDEQRDWRPTRFGYVLAGFELLIKFPVAKLLDYAGDLEALEASLNPFAPFVVAHLKTMETRHDEPARQAWKLRLFKGLYRRGYTREQILELVRLIDWIMDLSEVREAEVREELARFEEETKMPYVTSFERLAKAEGKAEAVVRMLERRFTAPVPLEIEGAIRAIKSADQLDRLIDLAVDAESFDEFRRLAQLLPG